VYVHVHVHVLVFLCLCICACVCVCVCMCMSMCMCMCMSTRMWYLPESDLLFVRLWEWLCVPPYAFGRACVGLGCARASPLQPLGCIPQNISYFLPRASVLCPRCQAAALCVDWALGVLALHRSNPRLVEKALYLLRRVTWAAGDKGTLMRILPSAMDALHAHRWVYVCFYAFTKSKPKLTLN
jgi:hypothetical protein